MRKFFVYIFLLLILPAVYGLADFFVEDFSPKYVEPGKYYNLTILMRNLGKEYAIYLSSELDPEDISPVDPIGAVRIHLNKASAAQETEFFGILRQNEEISLVYPIKIKQNIHEGVYSVPIVLKWKDHEFADHITTQKINIDVQKMGRQLNIYKYLPDYIEIGKEAKVWLKFENSGIDLKNVHVFINTTSPIGILNSNNFEIKKIKSGEAFNLSLNVIADPKAEPGLYPVLVLVEYETLYGEKRNLTEVLWINLKGKADINVADLKLEPFEIKEDEQLTIYVKVENSGTSDANSVSVSLELPFDGLKVAHLGLIPVKDDDLAIFILKPNKSGRYKGKIKIDYKDDLGFNSKIEPISLTVYPKNKNNKPIFPILVLLLIFIIAAIVLKVRR